MEKHNPATTQTTTTGFRYARVLLLDDNPVDNLVNKKLIETQKFAENVEVFESGFDALDYLRNENPDQLPEVIFLDIIMPKMDGFQFLDEFAVMPKEIRDRVRIIMLSTSDSFKDLNRANKNPFVYRFLNKPLTEQVLEAIHV